MDSAKQVLQCLLGALDACEPVAMATAIEVKGASPCQQGSPSFVYGR